MRFAGLNIAGAASASIRVSRTTKTEMFCVFTPQKCEGGGGGVSATIKRGDRRADGYTSQLLMSSLISEIVRHKISPKAIDFH